MVDVFFSVSPISSPLEGMSLGSKASSGSSEFEWPEEVIGLLEVRSDSVDFIDEIFNSVDSNLSKSLFNDGIIGERSSLFVDLAISSLKDEFSDGFPGWVSEGNIRLNSSDEI